MPLAVLDKRSIKKNNQALIQWLVHWSHLPREEATWEDTIAMEHNFPTFDPWGQGSSQVGEY